MTKLLVDGKNAFPEIIECMKNAQKSIHINMFIWRDDAIGNRLAEEVLAAANRGVKVTISKDTYGSVCEHAEEAGTSFFHKRMSIAEKVKVATLKIMYRPAIVHGAEDGESELYRKIMSHPNISVEADVFKADHSKFYIFDDETLILGGVNIEDKENGMDMSGRLYQDYMIRLDGAEYVSLFKTTRENGLSSVLPAGVQNAGTFPTHPLFFGINRKFPCGARIFDLEQMYLSMINGCQKELTIVMAYFSALPAFVRAICAAAERGVKVTLVIPGKANFQDDSNKKTVCLIMKQADRRLCESSGGSVTLWFSPKMLHTKLVATESVISFGSCNITKKAFNQLDELNAFIKAELTDLYTEILQSVQATIAGSTQVASYTEIKYNPFVAFLESFLV